MTNTTKELNNEVIETLAESGVLYSHKKSKADPRMRPFIVGNRYQLDVLDAGAVVDSLNKTADFMRDILSEDGTILFVGTTPPSQDLVKDLAQKIDQPYVTERWLGGTLTNFDVIRDRIDYFLDLKERREEGELEKYTKKEQVEFDKEIAQLEKKFGGITDLTDIPDAVFVVNIEKHSIAVKEARDTDVPVIGVIDTNDNPELVNYPIIANDHSRSSLEWVFSNLEDMVVIKGIEENEDQEAETSGEEDDEESDGDNSE